MSGRQSVLTLCGNIRNILKATKKVLLTVLKNSDVWVELIDK